MTRIEYPVSAAEPFLNDHRPGGLPLLGTAMGIEFMARTAQQVMGAAAGGSVHIDNVRVLDPLILKGDAATISVEVDSQSSAVQGWQAGESWVHMFEAQFREGLPVTAPLPLSAARIDAFRQTRVPGHAVYELFFHGPAFRVVGSAAFGAGAMFSELAADVPSLTLDSTQTLTAAPHWIELCMQTAGLLEIAAHARMMIPHRIDRIHINPVQPLRPPLFACAQERAGAGVDVTLLDSAGALCVQMTGYRTLPLPFAADTAAIKTLHERFSVRG